MRLDGIREQEQTRVQRGHERERKSDRQRDCVCLCGAYCQSGTHAGTCCGSGGALLPSSGAESREKDTGMLRGRAGIRIMNSPRTPGSPAVGPAVFWESERNFRGAKGILYSGFSGLYIIGLVCLVKSK